MEVNSVHFISPYSYSLEIGAAYNQAIDLLPPGAWVCITDQDTLKPPGFAERIRLVLQDFGTQDRLIGCRTNRVGIPGPYCVPGMFMEENISAHLEVAGKLWKRHNTDLEKVDVVPGYCMAFNKALWEAWGGFPDRGYRFDIYASQKSCCWIASGVYIFHLYRWLHPAPRAQVQHLNIKGYYLN